MKSHLYNTSLSGQPIPEDDVLGWAAGSSCTSLEDQEYPQDILGASWGSYLQSVPPTAGRSSRKVVINATPLTAQSKFPPVSTPSADQSPTRSILRTPLAKESDPHRKKLSSVTDEPHPLLYDLQSLFDTLAATKEKIDECGASNSPLVTLCDSLLGLRSDLKQAVALMATNNDANNNRVLSVLLELFKRIIQSLAKQGKKLQDKAVFLQQMGKQLNKSQMDFMKEQEQVQHALESARAQLMIEKQALDEGKAALNLSQEEFTQHLTDRGMLGRTKSNSTHILTSTMHMPGPSGHMQMVSMIQTQREQSKLERMLLQQQREMRKLQRAHDVTKAELLTAQEHGRRLQQKLIETSREARRNTVVLSNQLQTAKDSLAKTTRELEIEKRKSEDAIGKVRRRERVSHTVKGISTTQKALNLEIERMQRQLSDQQRTGHYLWQELRMSQRLRGTPRSKTSQHAAATSRVANKVAGRRGQGRKQEAGEGAWPHEKKQKLKKAVSSTSMALPTLPQSHQALPRKNTLPSYRFSKSELITLTQFNDPDTAQQVIEWLGQQGRLVDT